MLNKDAAANRARPFVIVSDTMAPTLCPGRDIAMVLPADAYIGEGIYAMTSALGGVDLYRVASAFSGGKLRLLRDNKAYADQTRTRAEFEADVIGKVVGRVEFFDRDAYAAFVDGLADPREA